MAREARISRLAHAEIPTEQSLSEYLRDARTRAEQIMREHPRYDGRTSTTCQPCLVDFPCDAVRAAQDVIAIADRLDVRRLDSSQALLEFMTGLLRDRH